MSILYRKYYWHI